MNVTMLGLGAMGSAMAIRLVESGVPVTVWNRTATKAEELARSGAAVAPNLREAVGAADVVITMLKDADAVIATMNEALAAVASHAVWAQMSTIGVRGTEQAIRLSEGRVRFVDAPVSGSRGPARQGALLVLASGPADAQPDVKPVFDVVGRATLWLGEAGAGTKMKLVVNAWLAALMEGMAETAALGRALGIGLEDVARCLHGGPLAAPIAEAKLAKLAKGSFEPDFGLALATKDIHLALDAARASGQPSLPLLEAVGAQWDRCLSLGLGDQDVIAAFRGLGVAGNPPAR